MPIQHCQRSTENAAKILTLSCSHLYRIVSNKYILYISYWRNLCITMRCVPVSVHFIWARYFLEKKIIPAFVPYTANV